MGRPRTKALPSGIYERRHASGRSNYWISFRDADGKRVQQVGGATIAEAVAALRSRQAEVTTGGFVKGKGSSEQNLATYAARWVEYRRTTGVRTVDREAQILRDHILPTLGKHRLSDIRPSTVADLVTMLEGTMAPKSVRNVHGVLSGLLSRARFEELVVDNAAKGLPRGALPKARRVRAVSAWTRAELERWITPAPDVPEEFTVAYAVAAFTGARVGEVAGLRWRDLDTEARPLWRWSLRTQYDGAPLKTDNPRDIPIHPELQRILAAWKLEGWPRLMCRHARPEDFVVPRAPKASARRDQHADTAHHSHNSLGAKAVHRYAQRLGVNDNDRDFHSFRRGMITVARTDGASKDVLERITHNAAGEMIDGYTYFGWEALCEAVACMRLAPLRGVVATRRISLASSDTCYADGDAVVRDGENLSDVNELWWRRRESNPVDVGLRAGIVGNSGDKGAAGSTTEIPTIPAVVANISRSVARVTGSDPTALDRAEALLRAAGHEAEADAVAEARAALWRP